MQQIPTTAGPTVSLPPPGIPTIGIYSQILRSNLFREIETFSDAFLKTYDSGLRDYARKWVPDPLHQWSRQWEYPFVYAQIKEWLNQHPHHEVTILDAGSGITFFPFYLASEFGFARILCCDQDASLEPTFASIIDRAGLPVGFSVADLHHLPYADASCDIVFSISVLEHTDAYERIFREFQRVLRPGGIVVLTFDISLDAGNEIADTKARQLLQTAQQSFSPIPQPLRLDARSDRSEGEILTTQYIKRVNKKLLPWKNSHLASLKNLLLSGSQSSFPNLTVFCQVLQKPTK